MAKLNITGKRFGRLVVVEQGIRKDGRLYCQCICDCGNPHLASQDGVHGGRTNSCGCLRRELNAIRTKSSIVRINGKVRKEYRSWGGAKERCYNKNSKKYPIYGGRGIKMHESWLHDFGAFLKELGPCPAKHTIERKDVNGDYAPGNCIWALPSQQARNMRTNVWITYKGLTMIETDWARHFKIDIRDFNSKWIKGMPIQEIEAYAKKVGLNDTMQSNRLGN